MKITPSVKKILRGLATGALLYVAASSPRGARQINKLIAKRVTMQLYRMRKRLKALEKEGYIILQGEKVVLTPKGELLLTQIQGEDVTLTIPHRWDGIWRLVAYDIPNKKKTQRDSFRAQLKEWGFVQVQESIWVFPYESKEEVAIVAKYLGINPFVLYMTAAHLPGEQDVQTHFNITRP